MQYGVGARGFHKDCVHRSQANGSDWQSTYTLVRFGLYLQDHSAHSGGLKVRLGSHNYAEHHSGKSMDLPSESGDLIVWLLTTSHSGNFLKLKGFPNSSIHPRIEGLLPKFLTMPEEVPRVSVFGTFGIDDIHLRTYLNYLKHREDFYLHYANSYFSEKARNLAKDKGVQLVVPHPSFGVNC